MKKALVLGGNGFIGSHLTDALTQSNIAVRVFSRGHLNDFAKAEDHPLIERIEGDFIHEGDVARALDGCDVCFHLVSTTLPKSSNDDPAFDVQTNIGGTIKLLNHAVKSGVKKIVFLSSGGTVYGVPQHTPIDELHATNPICSYGITKLAIEKYLELYRTLHGLEFTILRLSNPYGERQRLIATQGAVAVFLNKVLNNQPIEIWGDGSVIRDYIYIRDVTTAMLKAMDYQGTNRLFNIGAGEGKSLNQLIDAIESATGLSATRLYKESRAFDVPTSILCIKKAQEELGWTPKTSFEEGLARTVKWIRASLMP